MPDAKFLKPWAVKPIWAGFKVTSADGVCLAIFHTTEQVTAADAEQFAKAFATFGDVVKRSKAPKAKAAS